MVLVPGPNIGEDPTVSENPNSDFATVIHEFVPLCCCPAGATPTARLWELSQAGLSPDSACGFAFRRI